METRIKDVMVEKGVTSAKLAEMLGVSKATISNLINNKTMPSIDTLERISDVLGVQFVELFQKDDRELKEEPNSKVQVICPHCGRAIDVCVEVKAVD